MNSWPETNAQRICPICNHDRRCKIAPDGNGVRCFRVDVAPVGWKLKRKFASGGATFIREGATPQPRAKNHSATRTHSTTRRVSKLSSEQLHAAYSCLLEKLELSTLHCLALRKRGFNDEQIATREYRSIPIPQSRSEIAKALANELGDTFASVPGFGYVERTPKLFGAVGIAIPVRNERGQIVAITIRADRVEDGNKYTALSSAKYGGNSPGAPSHVPLGFQWPAERIRLGEGHLKSDVLAALDPTPTVSCGGVGQYRHGIDLAKRLGAKTLCLAFDMDASSNSDVARNLLAALQTAKGEGLAIELERWSPEHKGLDDAILAGCTPEVLVGNAAMEAAEEIATQAGVAVATEPEGEHPLVCKLRTYIKEHGIPAFFQNDALLKEIAAVAPVDKPLFAALRTTARECRVPMKDWTDALKPLIKDAAKDLPPTLSRDESGGFYIYDGCLARTRKGMMAEVPEITPIANFSCRIVDETRRDCGDGEPKIAFGIAGSMHDGRELPRTEVPAEKFPDMKWVAPAWGSDPTIWPGEIFTASAAIQAVSRPGQAGVPAKKYRHVYTHTGWREIEGTWHYLHANGSIPETPENSAYSVDLKGKLSRFALPVPPNGSELITAIRATLSLLSVAPSRVMIPLVATAFRAPLGSCGFAVSFVGTSGLGKTEIAALVQQHFGPELTVANLPGSWLSTDNANEKLLFQAKDAIVVVDDYAPDASSVKQHRQKSDRLFRSVGNHATRDRMNADGSERPSYPPRGVVISTAEDIAGSKSARARQFILEVSPGDVTLSDLTPHQANAADGLYAQTMAGYIAWIAERYEQVQRLKKERFAELRKKAQSERQHARTPGIVADLAFGFFLFLKFAEQASAITSEEREKLKDECWKSLTTSAADQAVHQTSSDPPRQFIKWICSGLATGRMHVADVDTDGPPDSPDAWGWRMEAVGTQKDWRAKGQRIGWTDGVDVFLDPSAAYAEAQQFAEESGETLAVYASTLFKALRDRKMLSKTEPSRKTPMVRKMIHGRRRSVLAISAELLSDSDEHTEPELGTTPNAAASCDAKLGAYPTQAELALADDAADLPQTAPSAGSDLDFDPGHVTGQLNGHRFGSPKLENHTGKHGENGALVRWSAHTEIEGPCNGYEEYTFM